MKFLPIMLAFLKKAMAMSSAEWIVESPSVNGQIASLANFGKVSFSSCTASTASGLISLTGSSVYAITIVAETRGRNCNGNTISIDRGFKCGKLHRHVG